jgi:hypothetical protein
MRRATGRILLLLALAGFAATAARGDREPPKRSEGILEAVDTQMRTIEIRNGEVREKIAFDDSTEIVRQGEKLRPSRLGRGSRLRVDWLRRGPRIVATRIEVVAPPPRG